jgi:hypothetical protein
MAGLDPALSFLEDRIWIEKRSTLAAQNLLLVTDTDSTRVPSR